MTKNTRFEWEFHTQLLLDCADLVPAARPFRIKRQKDSQMRLVTTIAATLSLLSACAPSPIDDDGFLREVPEQILMDAAPGQNLQAVKLLEEDNCFWYEYVGPVETTLLPLLSTRGRHFCIAKEEAPEAAEAA